MYAIIRDGGHQYRVAPGDSILIERTGMEPGQSVTFAEVLYADGKVGSPTLDGATVEAVVEEGDAKGPKIYVVKYKRRKNYRRRFGHRQHLTRVQIKAISATPEAGKKAAATTEEEATKKTVTKKAATKKAATKKKATKKTATKKATTKKAATKKPDSNPEAEKPESTDGE